LKQANFGVTRLDAQGATGPVQVVSSVIKRKELEAVVAIIKAFDGKAFYSVNELQSAEQGVFRRTDNPCRNALPDPVRSIVMPPRRIVQTVAAKILSKAPVNKNTIQAIGGQRA
jgi:hypothetical protein